MQIPVMTFNIQHGLDFKRRDRQALKAFDAMTPEYLEKLKTTQPPQEDPSLIDLSLTVRAIQTCGAEIIALNEVRDDAHHPCYQPQVRLIAEGLGYSYYHFGKAIDIAGQGPYGNGLISRYPILSVETIPIPDPPVQDEPTWYESRSLIRAEIDVAGGLTVLVTHMGLARSEAQNAVQTVLDQVQPGRPTLLMGDFNLPPDSPILAPLQTVFQDAGRLLPESENLTYPSDEPDRKIDYIMATAPIQFIAAQVPTLIVSDHRPHAAVIELP